MPAGVGALGRVTDRVACLCGHLLDGSRPCSRSVSPGFYLSLCLVGPGPLPQLCPRPCGICVPDEDQPWLFLCVFPTQRPPCRFAQRGLRRRHLQCLLGNC